MKKIIESALKGLNDFLKGSKWYGREREVVNLFAHKFLPEQRIDGRSISIGQISIEVAVKQLKNPKKKNLVHKDLVIWDKEHQTVWDEDKKPVNEPKVIIEWKVNDISKCEYDIDWLKKYTIIYPNVVGYSICAFLKSKSGIVYKRIEKGEIADGSTSYQTNT